MSDIRAWCITAIVLMTMMQDARAVNSIVKHWHPGAPNPLHFMHVPTIAAYGMWVPGCFATATIGATVVLQRELKLSEAWSIFGNCILPVAGGMMMRHLFAMHPEWDKLPLPPRYTYERQMKLGGT